MSSEATPEDKPAPGACATVTELDTGLVPRGKPCIRVPEQLLIAVGVWLAAAGGPNMRSSERSLTISTPAGVLTVRSLQDSSVLTDAA